VKIVIFSLLVIFAIPIAAQPIVSSGTIEIPGTYSFSFDKGIIVTPDVFWQRGSSSRFL
jgi:hypothetical protein